MSISALPSNGSLAMGLAVKGVSAAKVKVVQADLDASVAAVTGAGGTSGTGTAAVRAALDQRMAADMASGKLSQKDADAVNTTLDTLTPASGDVGSGTATATAAKKGASAGGARAAGGGGGGGEAATKTELSRVVTVSGALETITITYTDGSTDTETMASGGVDTAKAQGGTLGDAATDTVDPAAYQTRIDPGSLVSKLA